jgi:hypothetical protein
MFIDPDYLLDPKKTNLFTTADAYERDVRNVLINISKSTVGRTLFESIKWHGRWVRISPTLPIVGESDQACYPDTTTWGESQDLEFYRKAKEFLNTIFVQFRGIHAVVRFNPNQHMPGGNCFMDARGDFQPTPETVLLHELVHAFRHVSRTFDGAYATQGRLKQYTSPEEFNAVLVENIFRSEMRDHLRASHKGFHDLDSDLAGSFEFFKVSTKAFDLVEKFCRENKGLTGALARVRVSFNPIAAYYKNPRRAQEMSRSQAAVRRDVGAFINIPGVPWQMWLNWLQ